ncbi:MAG TPA: hypothetical protein VES65_11370 [Solirubrobacteraceae bacterium]|nr:hypothetical protein [Solirubrobacteraceae bacterium]
MTDAAHKPQSPRVLIGRANTPRGARRALLRIAQATLDGRLDPPRSNAVVYALSTVIKALEVEVVDRRLRELEKHVAGERPLPNSRPLIGMTSRRTN